MEHILRLSSAEQAIQSEQVKPVSFGDNTSTSANKLRLEYPRPDFRRDQASWLNLNGVWEFTFDDLQQGLSESWQNRFHYEGRINVPFAFQSKLSGIGDNDLHDYMWYGRSFELPENWINCDQRYILHFGAVDYFCQVWVNGRLIGTHQGGHVPFSFDVTDLVKAGEPNRLAVYVEDSQSKFQPRGKQYWKRDSEFCFYSRTSGIWQTVWLEAVAKTYLTHLKVQPDIDREEVAFGVSLSGHIDLAQAYRLAVEVSFEGKTCWQGAFELEGKTFFDGHIPLLQPRLWSPETPHLYDLRLTLYQAETQLETVESYFGMRKISVEAGRVLLNNQPYYLRLVLDQGYFPEGLLTAPSDAAFQQDIELTKAFGFNGARKHQKIEDPRWLYWADRLGLLVWGEMPSAYAWSKEAEQPFIEEWSALLDRDYNHPCIMAWVPFNESWGIEQIERETQQQEFVRQIVALTRGLDTTRLVIDNDGWQHLDRATDLLTIHDYSAQGHQLLERYARFKQEGVSEVLPLVSDRPILLPGAGYYQEPVLFTEFGGMSLINSDHLKEAHLHGDWGYSNSLDGIHLIEQYRGLIAALAELGFTSGFCYTQLTDVEQEVNGLLTYDRKPKVDPAQLARINQTLI